jgi:transcriptional regulator with XRE-family HTH domain
MSNGDILGAIAEAVERAIRDSGLRRRTIVEETGIPYSTLSRKLTGKTPFTLTELCLISEATGVSPSSFMPPVAGATA